MKNQKTNTHWHFRNIFLLLVILLCGTRTTLHSQNYPVQLTTQLIPPFSGYLPDYAAPDNSKLRLLVLFTDFSQPSYNIKFKFKLEGQGITIQSQSWYYDGPFTVEPGVPQMLSGDDLSGLLDENHLDFSGITRQLYDQRKVLPEGFYTITVTAYDFANPIPIQVSNEAVVQAWMVLNDPPMLNLPACSSTIQPIDPQQITFSWTPMNLAAPSSALGTEYTFDLWEIFPADANAGNIIASTAPLYSTVTSFPFVNYGIAEPPLIVGREYVWRVRAHDLENRELFRNNGYSQQCTFSWGNSNLLLGNIAAIEISSQVITHRQALCSWDSINVFSSYHLEFRKVNGNWFPANTNKASLRITDLEPNCNYEARVQGVFPDGNFGNWSNITSWQTPTQPQFSCGEQSPPPAMQNFHPLTQANTGMIWQAGQFEMQVLTLSNTSSGGGWYTGTGKIILPFGITVGCSFNGIQIGTDMVMYAGEIKAMTDGVGNWLSQYNLSQYQYDTSYFFAGNIDSLYLDGNGNLVIISNGDTTVININTEGGALITDSNGDQWIINPDGTITFVTSGYLLPLTNDTLSDQEMRIIKASMAIIRNEISPGVLSSKESTLNTNKAALESFIQNQRQALPIAQSSSPNPAVWTDTTEIIVYTETTGSTTDQGYLLGSNFKGAQMDYYSLRVLVIMAREECPDTELDFIGQYLTVNGILYKQYVSQQLASGQSESQIAANVAANGIKKLVVLVLKKQMSR